MNQPGRAARPVLVHVTTTDISLALLLGPQLAAFAQAGYEVIGVSAPGPFVADLDQLGIRHIELPHATRSFSLKDDILATGAFGRLLRRLRPDIVHTHNPKPGIFGRPVARLVGVPVVVNTVHGLYATHDDSAVRRGVVYGLERLAAAFSDAELVQNPEDLATLRRLRVPDERLHLLGNGVDLARFSAGPPSLDARMRVRSDLGAEDDTIVVTAVGRLVWEKGYRELFSAARLLRERCPKVMMVVAGPSEPDKADGVLASDLDAAAADGVRFLGHLNDIEDLYAASDVYVLASHREGFPRSAMEAAAMGLPVVATDIRGCRQVVDDGLTGFLVPARDPTAMADAITRLATDRDLRRSMGEAAAVKAVHEFDQRRVIGITLGIYEQLLSARLR